MQDKLNICKFWNNNCEDVVFIKLSLNNFSHLQF